MRILYYNCFSGISGDMNMAAMIDLGIPADYLNTELEKLNIKEYSIAISKELKMGIYGTQVKVNLENEGKHSHTNHHHHNHSHRTFSNIKELINNSALSNQVKETSINIFEKIAIAEGKIHNKPSNEVHFHEVGAVDSIVDIVGAAICYHYLKPDKVMCSTVELGGGFINCAHGKFPVPAPATAEILKNIPVKLGTVQFETTTPTGAAILACLVDEFTDEPNFSITKTAYGIGHRDMDIPNVLRVHIAELQNNSNFEHERAKLIECNIDDMPAEQFDFLIDRLISDGAQDVYLTPIIMKKSRPATKLSVLCNTTLENTLTNIILKESTSLGVRCYEVSKSMLQREIRKIETRFGTIDVKIGILNGLPVKMKPEYDQCKELALKHKVPISVVINEVQNNIKKVSND